MTEQSPEDPGYETPYAKFLEKDLDEIEEILRRLILAHGEHQPIDAILAEIEESGWATTGTGASPTPIGRG